MRDSRDEPDATQPVPPHLPSVRSTFASDLATLTGIRHETSVDLSAAKGPRPARVGGLEGASSERQRYVYEGDVGRGGMGAVYRVRDENLRRSLAMKVMLGPEKEEGEGRSERSRELSSRFLEEAQITGQLEHPGVVPVYDLGLDQDRQLYFTMRLVRGSTFEDVIDAVHAGKEGWTRARALGVLLKVCETMSYAHDHGVVHRDLKPANVMVGSYGEAYVVDWGLARVEGRPDTHDLRPRPEMDASLRTDRRALRDQGGASPLVTMDGTVFGTPYYMAREQAAGRTESIGPRSDVYAVGAMLYHLLTGCKPYHRAGDRPTAYAVLAQVLHGPPQPVHELVDNVPPELEAICERATAREPEDRYASMAALGEDLRAYLEGRVVHAYETGALAELKKWVQRNRSLAAALVVALLLALGGAGSVGWVQARARRSLQEVNGQLNVANAGLSKANAKLETERATSERVVTFLTDMFRQEDPSFSRGATITVKEVLDAEAARIPSQLEQEPEVRLRLMGTMGKVYQSLGLYPQARPLLRGALEQSRALLGDDRRETWAAADRLGSLLIDTGEFEEARGLLEDALARREQGLGPEDPDTLLSRYRLATLKYHLQDMQGAEELFARTLDAQTRVLGADDPATLETRQNMAALLVASGRGREALDEYRALVTDLTRSAGEDEPRTLFAISNVAFVLEDLGELEEAEGLCGEVLDRRTRVLGPAHPDTLTSLHNLALVHFRQNRWAEAQEELQQAYEAREKQLGENAFETLQSLSSLAHVLTVEGEDGQAQELLERFLPRARKALASNDSTLIDALRKLAGRYRSLGREDEARDLESEIATRLR